MRNAGLKLLCSLLFPVYALASDCERIVTLAPSVTETLVSMDLGKNVVGKVRYDQSKGIPDKVIDIGGFLDPNIESIAALRPSVVFLLKESSDIARLLDAISIKTIVIEHRSVSGILDSIDKISEVCTIKTSLRVDLEKKLNEIKKRVSNLQPKKVLVLVRNDGDDSSHSFFVSGKDGYYDELLGYAGGVNVFKKHTTALGTISEESILLLNPEVILHFSPAGSDFLPLLNFKQFLISEDYAMIPGPRAAILAERIAKTLHPEAFNEDISK